MLKVLITSRSFGLANPRPLHLLEAAGIEWIRMEESYEPENFRRLLSDCQALIIGAHELPDEAIAASPHLKIVCKHGAGLDNLNLDFLARHHIKVTHAPGVNAAAVADLTFGLMLGLARKIPAAVKDVKAGNWRRFIGVDLNHKHLGLIGFGAIARQVALRARGFGMTVSAHDPYLAQAPPDFTDVELLALPQVLRQSDFVSLHVPLSEQTWHLIDAERLSLMRPQAFLINTSRGGIVDEHALLDALKRNKLAGAALDVLEKESADTPLRDLEQVIITPHIGMYSKESIHAVSMICAENVVAALKGGHLQHQVKTHRKGKDPHE